MRGVRCLAGEGREADACAAVRGIEVELHWQHAPEPALLLIYVVRGALNELRLPGRAAAPTRTDGLWQHTCFEAFVGTEGNSAYREFNFAPSADWAACWLSRRSFSISSEANPGR